MLNLKKHVKLTVDNLVMRVVENNSSFSIATKKHENHSGAINCSFDKSSLNKKKDKKRKENNTTLFLK